MILLRTGIEPEKRLLYIYMYFYSPLMVEYDEIVELLHCAWM